MRCKICGHEIFLDVGGWFHNSANGKFDHEAQPSVGELTDMDEFSLTVVGKSTLDDLVKIWGLKRKAIPLKSGEECPRYSLFTDDPPEGFRWETDEELRQRHKRSVEDRHLF
jgi:hypothetical protein